jgi:hypothetical protein
LVKTKFFFRVKPAHISFNNKIPKIVFVIITKTIRAKMHFQGRRTLGGPAPAGQRREAADGAYRTFQILFRCCTNPQRGAPRRASSLCVVGRE